MADHKRPHAQIIDYSKPENQDVAKTATLLARTDRAFALELLQVEASTRPMATTDDIPTLASYETGRLIDARIGADHSDTE